MSRFPYIVLRLASTRNTPICTQCTRTGESLRFAPVPLMPYNFSSICTLSKSAAKAEYGLLLRDRKSLRISPQACKVLADGSALLFVRYRHRNLRPILKPEGQELLFAHRDCFYSRVPNVRVKLCQDVPALPQLVQTAADLFLFALSGMDFGFQPGYLRFQLLTLVMQGVIPLSILRLILHLMLVFLNAALQQLHFGVMAGLELCQVLF